MSRLFASAYSTLAITCIRIHKNLEAHEVARKKLDKDNRIQEFNIDNLYTSVTTIFFFIMRDAIFFIGKIGGVGDY